MLPSNLDYQFLKEKSMTDIHVSSSTKMIVDMPKEARHALAHLQQRMGTQSPAKTIERAFREFAREMGHPISEEPMDSKHMDALVRFGLHAHENVQPLREAGKIVINLPNISNETFAHLKEKAQIDSIRGIVQTALAWAYNKYVS